jgi:hopene-associated glycosyltransferase HpnB
MRVYMLWVAALLAFLWGSYAVFGRRWRIVPRLLAGGDTCAGARVVAVVPARNEANELPQTLPSLLQQRHANLTVVLVDDHSEDGTAEVARKIAVKEGASERLIVVTPPPLASGWTGKVWAQHHGVERAHRLDPDWIWLTDADIRHDADVLSLLLATAARERRDFVSVMARLRCDTAWERLLIPAFTYFFAGLYSFLGIGDDRSRAAGAAGGCVLVRAALLQRVGGMASIPDAVIDDVSLGRVCKAAGARLWLGYHPGVVSTRGYRMLGSIWDMVARSAYTQLGYSPVALVGCVVGLVFVFFAPAAAIVCGTTSARLLGAVAYAAMVRTYLPMVAYLGAGRAWALLLPVAAVLYAGMTVSSAWRHHSGAGARWKGRAYGTPGE